VTAAGYRPVDHVVAACVMDGPLPGMRDGDTAVATAPGRSACINSYRDHPPVTFLLYRTDWSAAETRKKPSDALRQAFAGFGGDVEPAMLDAMDRSESVLFDQVSQIHLNRWSQGRVLLLGDSAWCMTALRELGSEFAPEATVRFGELAPVTGLAEITEFCRRFCSDMADSKHVWTTTVLDEGTIEVGFIAAWRTTDGKLGSQGGVEHVTVDADGLITKLRVLSAETDGA
jgi:hypothetical protein